jgi:branched-subunit amino acid transport protein
MSDARIWLVVIGLTLVSIVTRSFFLLLGARITLSEEVQRALRYAPVGALVAIVIPEIFMAKASDGAFVLSVSNPQMWGGVAATLGAMLSRSMLVTLLVGMVVYSSARVLF